MGIFKLWKKDMLSERFRSDDILKCPEHLPGTSNTIFQKPLDVERSVKSVRNAVSTSERKNCSKMPI